MLQPGRELDLPFESLGAERGGELGEEHLERHPAVVLQVVGKVDGRHPAAAQLALEAVPFGKGRTEAGNGLDQLGTQWWGQVKSTVGSTAPLPSPGSGDQRQVMTGAGIEPAACGLRGQVVVVQPCRIKERLP